MSKKFVKESFGMGFGDRFCDCESDPVEYNGRTYDTWTMYGGDEVGDVMFADDALRQDMEENGIDEEIMKMVDVWVNPRDRVEDAIDQITSDDMYTEGFFGDLGDALDDGIRGVKKFFHKAKFKKGDKIMVCMGDFSPPGVQHGLEVIDTQYGGWSGGWEYKTGTDKWGNPEWWPELRVALDTDPDGGYEEYDPAKFPEFKKLEKYMKKKDSKKKPVDEGTYWPTPESERIPVYTLELSRIDDDEAYVETPMKYSKIYHSDDEAFEDAEKLAEEYANEDGKFEVHVMAGEY